MISIQIASICNHRWLHCAAVILLSTTAAHTEVKTERTDYHGWTSAYRMTNGTIELIYVPQIGRIIRFGYVNSTNLLWENLALSGKLPDASKAGKEWQNFGGDKVWPAPQSVWNWPPDYSLDPGEYSATILSHDRLKIEGKPSTLYGIRISREIQMDAKSAKVTITNTITNANASAAAKECKWSVWEVAQVDDPDVAMIPAGPDGAFVKLSGDTLPNGVLNLVGDQLHLTRDSKHPTKIGSTNPGKWAAMEKHGRRFRIQMRVSTEPGAQFPDSHSMQELYTNPDPLKYVELELLGPIMTIAPGKSIKMTTVWTLQ